VASSELGERDAAAFERLYVENEASLFDYLSCRLGPTKAEHAVAEVFAAAWQRFPTLGPTPCLRTWVLGLAIAHLDARRRDELDFLREMSRGRDDVASSEEADPTRHKVQLSPGVARALTDLGAFDRDLLTLHLWANLGYASLAEITGMRVLTLTQRLRMARRFVSQYGRA
jgi:DNA-directed RNA polymerase specialized sigma24 family protein